ncbi:MAG: hypothetical protein BGO82_05605 [Devosia sp. 67-54]|nr:MAG: hypothetical protein BGO82_05605 [Devosia sp. 67-54]
MGIFASQDSMRQRLVELISFGSAGDDRKTISLSRTAEPIDRETLENAFVKGRTKSAWLDGLHVPTELKADRKVLSGPNLRYALDHFDDQTFLYSAAISEVPQASGEIARIGVSHAKGTLWTKSTKTFDEFADELKSLVKAIRTAIADPKTVADLERAGLPVVAKPAVTASLPLLSDGFDVGYEAPTTQETELLTGEISEPVLLDEWQRRGSFVVNEAETAKARPSEIIAGAYFDSILLATIRFEPVRRTDTSVEILHRVLSYEVDKADERMVALDKSLMKRNTNLTLRYGSGHVVQNSVLYAMRFHDVIFENWQWKKFAPAADGKKYKLRDEKPTKRGGKGKMVYAPELIGKSDSLFCYVRNNIADLISTASHPVNDWQLLCDDGSGEIADFIALSSNRKLVTFIHVKATKTGSATTISVTPFSEVVSQATKNLRNFDHGLLIQGINDRTTDRNKDLVWRQDGTATNRAKFCTELDKLRPMDEGA